MNGTPFAKKLKLIIDNWDLINLKKKTEELRKH